MSKMDLHTHSTASDGSLTPRELVAAARREGVGLMALTDHDTIDGVAEAREAGKELGVTVLAGVELSVDHEQREMHLLGYHIDPDHPALRAGLQQLIQYREERNPKIIELLRSMGIPITMEEVAQEAGSTVIGRPHFGRVLVKKGIVASVDEAFARYLGSGKPAYVKKERLLPEEGIALLRRAGGIPVLAHPVFLPEQSYSELLRLLQRLKAAGLAGIEAYYPEHSFDDIRKFVRLAAEIGLYVTGGSDFHGSGKPSARLGRILPDGGPLPEEVRKRIEEWIGYV
ncbi:PHP domain-containing protein [Heliobacterium gestii]|uniref:PHP domain-containing protein n=1 Tax=Heliomicrobium gestii TaxID=2699 RepID=A0A845L5V0_HELGE|nr:PHP domain-containing protein [Heliomicrobium gestii]MBM7865317.1 putative metal-dependent phosphoesterase TrpH [Heliomicrobium gestii]MZP41578.1 PHP domain-containing protein [Heliomicrobium gestii]